MRPRYGSLCVILGASAWLAAPALAIPNAELKQNYQGIIDRNPFALKPPPQPAPPPAPKPEEKPKTEIYLTGITSVGYPRVPKKAYLKIQEQGKKDATFLDLREDESRDGITVLGIDDRQNTVRIRTDTGETLLSFKTHGIAPPVAPVAPAPGQPGAAPGRPGVPGQPGVPAPLPTTAANAAMPGGGQPIVATANQPAAGSAYSSTTRLPSRRIRSGVSAIPAPGTPGGGPAPVGGGAEGQMQQPAPEPIDPAIQYINSKAQEELFRRQGVELPPIPPP